MYTVTRQGIIFEAVAHAERHYTVAGQLYVKAQFAIPHLGRGQRFEGFAIHELAEGRPGRQLVPRGLPTLTAVAERIREQKLLK